MSNPTQDQPGEAVPQNPYGAPAQPYGAVPAQPYGAPAQPYGADPAQPGFAYGAPAPKKRSTGKIIGIVAAIVVVVIIIGVVAIVALAGGTKKVTERLNPGCVAAESYFQQWSTKTQADATNPDAFKADLKDAVTELNKDAAKSTNAGAKAAILKLSADMQEILDDFNSGTVPPASITDQVSTDGTAVDTACGR